MFKVIHLCKFKDPICSAPKYLQSKYCYKHMKLTERLKKEERAERKKKRHMESKSFQKSELRKWSKKAWGCFSTYIRRRAANFQDQVECYTCYKLYHWKEAQAGHFKHRGNRPYQAIDFNLRHIQIQCYACNCGDTDKGQQAAFYKHLVNDYGAEWPEEIEKRRREEPPLTIEELKKIFETYSSLLKQI